MQFTDVNFILLFVIVLPIYYIIPSKLRSIVLLLLSYAFMLQFGLSGLIFLFCFSAVVYVSGLLIGLKHVKPIYILLFLLVWGFLILWKNQDLATSIVNYIGIDWTISIIAPVGLSFFTLQGLSYLSDVKNDLIKPEKNILKVFLYISYFPCITSGPIQKGSTFFPILSEGQHFDYDLVRSGLIQMLWGYFQKLVISNRLSVFVNSVFTDQQDQAGIIPWLGAIAFGIQLYIDFCGYSDIVIGISKTLGIPLGKNFDHPYMAKTIQEFWQKWHISLSHWLRDYIYIPLGGNRKGALRKYINITIVFIISGLWHGGGLVFIIWGLLHAFYQITGQLTKGCRGRIRTRLGIADTDIGYIWFQRICVFIMVDFAWIFFRASSYTDAVSFIKRMGVINLSPLVNGDLLSFGLTIYDWIVVLAALVIFCIGQTYRRRLTAYRSIGSCAVVFRWILYIAAVFVVIWFGVYGSGGQVMPFNYFMF